MLSTQSFRPVDVVVACRIYSLAQTGQDHTFASLASDLGVAPSTTHDSVNRCMRSQVIMPSGAVNVQKLRDLLLYVVPVVCPASLEGTGPGMPTATAAPFAADTGFEPRRELPYVWSGHGKLVGVYVTPLHPSVPELAGRDPLSYELLALADVARFGTDAERKLAGRYVDARLGVAKGAQRA